MCTHATLTNSPIKTSNPFKHTKHMYIHNTTQCNTYTHCNLQVEDITTRSIHIQLITLPHHEHIRCLQLTINTSTKHMYLHNTTQCNTYTHCNLQVEDITTRSIHIQLITPLHHEQFSQLLMIFTKQPLHTHTHTHTHTYTHTHKHAHTLKIHRTPHF